MSNNYFGIDFGTTNSAVVAITEIDENNFSINKSGESEKAPLPSFVAINKNTGEVRTGLTAKRNISNSDEYITFSSVKSIIGEELSWNIAGKTWTPIDIAAELCETAKCALADEDFATVRSMSSLDNYGRPNEQIDYDFFSVLIENEVNIAYECLTKALSEAGMNKESIDCILCVGGSSRLRPFQEKLLATFDREKVIFPHDAMWDIAGGASQVS